jgi:hypothetical protein
MATLDPMFDPAEREQIREQLTEKARSDAAVVAAAVVGSTATGGDRWSDLDLTFAVAPETTVEAVLARWTRDVVAKFGAAVLFDLPVGSTVYRVFLFPGALQVDLSFSPSAEFGARGPRFRLLFGKAVERPFGSPPSPEHTFGYGVHHAVRAHVCIARGQFWQAEYWLHQTRDYALTLACHRLGLDVSYARGYDALPPEVHAEYAGALVGTLADAELRRALAVAAAGLLREAGGIPSHALAETVARVRPMLAPICDPARTLPQSDRHPE